MGAINQYGQAGKRKTVFNPLPLVTPVIKRYNTSYGSNAPIVNTRVSNGVNTYGLLKQKFQAVGNCTNQIAGWINSSKAGSNAPTANTVILSAWIEISIGVYIPITFSGSTQKSLVNAEYTECDALPNMTDGQIYFIWTGIQVNAGEIWYHAYQTTSAYGEAVATGTTPLTPNNGIANSTGYGFGCVGVFGISDSAKPAINQYGDSLTVGVGDTAGSNIDGANSLGGLYGRTFVVGKYPNIQFNIASEKVNLWVEPLLTKFNPMFKYAKYFIDELGINDIINSTDSISTIKQNKIGLWEKNRLAGTLFGYVTSITPRTTSTDNWATTTNQSVSATREPLRVELNNWIRDGAPIDSTTRLHLPIGSSTTNTIRMNQLNHPLKGYFELADIAETSRNSGIWKANSTSDGIHPNASMYNLLYPAIDLSVFV